MLERVVELEPRYADAWAALGGLRHSMADSGYDPDPRWYALAEEAMRRALALEPENAQASFLLGALELVRGRKREAYRMFSEAYRRIPNDFGLAHYFAYLYRLCNMWDEFFAAETGASRSTRARHGRTGRCGAFTPNRGASRRAGGGSSASR